MNIIEIVEQLPNILEYVAYGYIYLAGYHWVHRNENEGTEYMLMKSIAISFVLKNIYNYVSYIDNPFLPVAYTIISGILGIIAGSIVSRHWFNALIKKFGIWKTTNDNIWDDIIGSNTWLNAYHSDGTIYVGMVEYYSDDKENPIIVLCNTNKVEPGCNQYKYDTVDKNRRMIIRPEMYERIEVVYDQKSNKYKS